MNVKTLFGLNRAVEDRFLMLPEKLYGDEVCPQDIDTERSLLNGTHPLSGDFEILPMIAIDDKDRTLARCMLTFYEGEVDAYLGFFESVNDADVCRVLLKKAEETSLKKGKKAIIGPIDSSIFIGYRFKTDHFTLPYTGEPINKPYYAELWEKCGFEIWKKYYSYRLKPITEKEGNPKYSKRVKDFRRQGYEYKNLRMGQFDEVFHEIYGLLMERFSSFPGYKPVSRDVFRSLFHKLRIVLRPDDVLLIYKDKKLVAFSISLPNFYDNLLGEMNVWKILKILWLKHFSKETVYLYMGVAPGHLGLGSVMAELTRRQLYRNGRVPIKALIQENKATGVYYNDLTDEKMEYVLLRKNI